MLWRCLKAEVIAEVDCETTEGVATRCGRLNCAYESLRTSFWGWLSGSDLGWPGLRMLAR